MRRLALLALLPIALMPLVLLLARHSAVQETQLIVGNTPSATGPRRITIETFDVRGLDIEAGAGEVLAEMLRHHLDPALYQVVENAQASPSQPAADYVVSGRLSHLSGYHLTASMTRSDSGSVVATAVLSAPDLDRLLDRLGEAAQQLSPAGGKRVAIERGTVGGVAPLQEGGDAPFLTEPGIMSPVPPRASGAPSQDWGGGVRQPWGMPGTLQGATPRPGTGQRSKMTRAGSPSRNVTAAPATTQGGATFRVLAGVYSSRIEAERLAKSISSDGFFPVEVFMRDGTSQVIVGPVYGSEQQTTTLLDGLRDAGYFDVAAVRLP